MGYSASHGWILEYLPKDVVVWATPVLNNGLDNQTDEILNERIHHLYPLRGDTRVNNNWHEPRR